MVSLDLPPAVDTESDLICLPFSLVLNLERVSRGQHCASWFSGIFHTQEVYFLSLYLFLRQEAIIGRVSALVSKNGCPTTSAWPITLSSCALSRVQLFVTLWIVAHQACLSGISQARILEWVSIPFSGDPPDPGIEPTSPALVGRFFIAEPSGKPH